MIQRYDNRHTVPETHKLCDPFFISTAFVQLLERFDTAIIGQILGMRELAAIGATNSVTFFILRVYRWDCRRHYNDNC